MATKLQRYDVALNGQGLILASRPEQPRILARQDTVFGNRFAQGDRGYNDLAKWWYMVQTDWLGGIKDNIEWSDDAKQYYSTNIDAFSEQGAIKLTAGLALDTTFIEKITCGDYITITSAAHYIGTDDSVSSKPVIYSDISVPGTFADISSVFMPATRNFLTDVLHHKSKVTFSTVSTEDGTTYVVGKCDDDGANPVDYSADIAIACSLANIKKCYAIAEDGNTLWAAVDQNAGQSNIVKTTDEGGTWTKLLSLGNDRVICILPIGTDIYYLTINSLVGSNGSVKLRKYNGTAETQLHIFQARTNIVGKAGTTGTGSRKLLKLFNNKIVITLIDEIWEYDLSTTELILKYKLDEGKSAISTTLAIGQPLNASLLTVGAVEYDNKLWWGNLVYDGQYFYNSKRDTTDSDTIQLYPLYTNGTDIFWIDDNNDKILYVDSGYKGTADKNFLVFNNYDRVSGIDKLAYSVVLIFKTLVSGQKIEVEYLVDELTSSSTWTSLGSASFAVNGAIKQATLYFGDAVVYKKIWFRVKLEGGGSNTPVLYDFVHAYLPMPDYKLQWNLVVKCLDEQSRKDQTKEPKSAIWIRNYLQQSWLTKSILSFEDFDASVIDYVSGSLTSSATTITVKGTTDGFPELGRLLIETEEIFYTGKTKNTFTGCARGARGTNAVAHSDGANITMAHRVIIRDYQEELILANDPNKAEYNITLHLAEL